MTLEEAKKELKRLSQESLKIIERFDTEHVVISDTFTLNELSSYLSKVVKFKYLTIDRSHCTCWSIKPTFGLLGYPFWDAEGTFEHNNRIILLAIDRYDLRGLDLSEYKDESGNVDYSKCIVEVE